MQLSDKVLSLRSASNRGADRTLYLRIAAMVGEHHGTCIRRNVGALLVADGRTREIGWNGMERAQGTLTCVQGGCPRGMLSLEDQPRGSGYSNCRYLHAEFNVAENFRHAQRARNVEGWALNWGIVIYTSSVPCEDCTKYCAWAGIVLDWVERE
jgi:dCMP deaminase